MFHNRLKWSGKEDSNLRPLPPEDGTPAVTRRISVDVSRMNGAQDGVESLSVPHISGCGPHFEPPTPVLSGERCLSTSMLAKHFGVGRTTIHQAIQRGDIPFIKVGNLYRVRVSEIPQFVVDRWTEGKWCGLRADLPKGPMVYFLSGIPGYVKIGFTANLSRRVQDLQPGSPVRLELVAMLAGGGAIEEAKYHRRFHRHRVESEWFRLCDEIEAEINRLGPCLTPTGEAG